MFKKTATLPGTVSAEQMFSHYAQHFVDANPTYFTRTWKYYVPHGEIFDKDGKSYRNYRQFKDILTECNKEIAKRIIEGYSYNLGNGMGDLFAARIERGRGNKRLNMLESLKLRKKKEADGTLTIDNWKVYYTDEEYIGIVWHKKRITNRILYSFKTAGGTAGKSFKSQFSTANLKDKLLRARYPFLPSLSIEE